MKILFSAMYPRTIIAFNIERNTMIGKLEIEDFNTDPYPHIFEVKKPKNKSDEDEIDVDLVYNAGKDFMDNYLTHDWMSIGTKWFNLPDFEKINDSFRNEFKIKKKKIYKIKKMVTNFLEKINITIGDKND